MNKRSWIPPKTARDPIKQVPGKPVSTRARCPEAREQRRNAILGAASRIFADLGYGATEMDRVALELGLSKGTLYLYFANKEALFLACVDQGMRALTQVVRDEMTLVHDPLDKLVVAFRAYLRFIDEHPDHVELLIQERANFKDRKTQTYFEHRANNRAFWKGIYQALIDQKRIHVSLSLDEFLDQIGNLLYGTMFTRRYATTGADLDKRTADLVTFVFQGVLSPGQSLPWETSVKGLGGP